MEREEPFSKPLQTILIMLAIGDKIKHYVSDEVCPRIAPGNVEKCSLAWETYNNAGVVAGTCVRVEGDMSHKAKVEVPYKQKIHVNPGGLE